MARGSFHRDFPATSVLLLTTIGFYLLETIYHWKTGGGDLARSAVEIPTDILVSLGALSLRRLENGEVWRLISYAFLHGSLIHLLLNALALYDLGRECEPLLSTRRFTVVYLGCAIGAGLASAGYAGYRGAPATPAVGASGALFGLIGLVVAYSIRHRDRGFLGWFIHWLIYVVLISFLVSRVDHAGHAGGFLTGAVFGLFTPRPVTSQNVRRWRIPFQVAAGLTVLALCFALWNRARLPLGG